MSSPALVTGAATPAAGALATDVSRDAQAKAKDDKIAGAARQFEGVLVQQMLKVLWQSSPVLAGPQGEMYRQMFEGALADHMVSAGGIGLAPMLERALGQKAGSASQALPTVHRSTQNPLLPTPAQTSATGNIGAAGTGELSRIQAAASDLLEGGGQRWSKDGALSPRDLFADLGPRAGAPPSSSASGGGDMASASVAGARGYQGYYKCNLFALEMARRAGFAVPLQAGAQGPTYPLSNDITRDAADGQVSADWAKVVTGETAGALDASLSAGTRALMLTGAGDGDRHGHMAVVERIHSIEYGKNGELQRIVFDGWEARPEGASHLRERTWNAQGNAGGHDPRNGFQRIEILELKRPRPDASPKNPPPVTANQAQRDDLGSRPNGLRPIHSSEDES